MTDAADAPAATEREADAPYRVLVPVSDNEASAQAQAAFVASLPNAAASVEVTLTHVLHGEELATPRESRSAQRIGTVMHARRYLREREIAVRVMDADHPFPPTKGILALADRTDADLIVLGGGMHGLFDDLLTGAVTKSVGRRTDRPVAVVRPLAADLDDERSANQSNTAMTARPKRDMEVPPAERIQSLRTRVRGDVHTPNEPGYDAARHVWNGMIDRYPALVVRATGTADVVATVDFARENDLELSVHGGGHNVAGTAVTDGGVMLDLSSMNGVRIDRDAETVRAEGGAVLGDVDHETQLFGLATPLGAVSKTGIAGLTLNGGYGHLSREYGLAADALVSVDIVTADGQVRTASETANSDLFWAVRGGGGNFGVVTSFEYELHEVGPEVYACFVWFHGDDARAVLDAFREWTDDAPRTAGVLPFVGHVPELDEFPREYWGEPTLALLGSARGDIDDGRAVYQPLFEAATPIADFSGPTEFETLQSMLDEDYPDGLRYYWKSVFLTEMTDDVLDVVLRYNESAPSTLSTVDLWHLGGAVSDVPQDATAFWHRDKPFMCNFEANWEDPADDDANVAWVREGLAELEALPVASGRYGNFPGFGEDPARALFGENYERLVEIKTEYDPDNLFHLNQNVEPRPGDE